MSETNQDMRRLKPLTGSIGSLISERAPREHFGGRMKLSTDCDLGELKMLMGSSASIEQARTFRASLISAGFAGRLTQDIDAKKWRSLLFNALAPRIEAIRRPR